MNKKKNIVITRAKMPLKFQILCSILILGSSYFSLDFSWGIFPILFGFLIISFEDGLLIDPNEKSISNYFKFLWIFTIKKKVNQEPALCLTVVHFTEFTSRNLTASAVRMQKDLCKVHLILPNKKYVTLLTGYKNTLVPQAKQIGMVMDLDVHFSSAQSRELLHKA